MPSYLPVAFELEGRDPGVEEILFTNYSTTAREHGLPYAAVVERACRGFVLTRARTAELGEVDAGHMTACQIEAEWAYAERAWREIEQAELVRAIAERLGDPAAAAEADDWSDVIPS
jgi:hypothetical protein